MSTRPKVFYWWDAVTFGAAATLLSLATIIGWLRPGNDWRPLLAGSLVSVGSWGMYGALLLKRWLFVRSIAYVTTQGISVVPSGFICPKTDFESDVNDLISLWLRVAPEFAGKIPGALDGLVVIFKPYPFQLHGRPGPFAGLTYPASKQSFVGYRMPLSSSALDHELGHIIYGTIMGNWSQEGYHTFAKERKLP